MFEALRLKKTLTLACLLFVAPSLALALTAPGDAASSVALERALDKVDAEHIKADIYFIASDEMRGRDTPSPELRIAARFIAARLERLGWQPAAEHGYFFEFELPIVGIDGERSSLTATSGEQSCALSLGSDYAFHPSSIADYEAVGESIIFVGDFDKQACKDLDLRDRWVMARSSSLDVRKMRTQARRAKAKGLLVIPGAELDDAQMQERVHSWGTKALEGKLQRGRSRKAFPMLYLTSAATNKLCALAGQGLPKVGDVLALEVTEQRASLEDAKTGLENVCGIWPGSDPLLKDEVLIVSAHYDHVGVNDEGEVYNGADDNGSGTSGLLAIAGALTEYGPLRRSVMLMWVAGEEKGLLGSKAWTKDPWLPEGLRPVCDINIDMIGRNAPDYLLITPTKDREEYNGLVRLAEANAPLEGFPELGSCDAYWSRSDHINFSTHLKIPVTFLFSDVHEDYHKPSDTPDKINFDKVRRVARLVLRMLDGLQADQLEL